MKVELQLADKHVWKARILWAALALVVLGNLAVETAGTAVDVTDKPVLSLVALTGVVVAYPLLRVLMRRRAVTPTP